MIDQRKYIEVYNCVDITVLGSSEGDFLGIIPVVNTGW